MANITGTNGNDTLFGSTELFDTIIGLDGDDVIFPSPLPFSQTNNLKSAAVDGGNGFDTLELFLTEAINVYHVSYLGGGIYRAQSANTIDFSNIEKLVTTYQATFEYGNPGVQEFVSSNISISNTLAAPSGSTKSDFISIVQDSFSGTLAQYDANDVQTYQLYFNHVGTFETGEGDDQVSIVAGQLPLVPQGSPSQGFWVELGNGNDSASLSNLDDHGLGSQGTDSIVGMGGADNLYGGAGDDALYGETGNDVLVGDTYGPDPIVGEGPADEGDDQLLGGAGADFLYGEGGADRLFGGTQADQLFGGSGDDYLAGGVGLDHIRLGGGKDQVFFASRSEGADLIFNFTARNAFTQAVDDRILLDNAGFRPQMQEGRLNAANFFVATGSNTSAQDGNDYFVFRTSDDTLWFDANANWAGGQTLVCDFANDVNLTAANIFIV